MPDDQLRKTGKAQQAEFASPPLWMLESVARVKLAKEQAEQEQIALTAEAEKTKKAELFRLAQEQAEQEQKALAAQAEIEIESELDQFEQEQAKKKRIDQEQAEKERLNKEQAERELLAQEQIENERFEKAQAERAEKAELVRLAEEHAEKERLAKEQNEKARLVQEQTELRKKAELDRLAREQVEKERLARIKDHQPVWYVVSTEGKIGPKSFLEVSSLIQSEKVSHHSLLWRKGMKQWEYASQIPEFESALSDIPPPLSPPPMLNSSSTQSIAPKISPPMSFVECACSACGYTFEIEKTDTDHIIICPNCSHKGIGKGDTSLAHSPKSIGSKLLSWSFTGIIILAGIVLTFGGRACREQKQREKLLDAAENYRQTHQQEYR